jgi:hypothetical protein
MADSIDEILEVVMKRVSWINLILGIWLIISPMLVGYSASHIPAGNNVILGVLLIASSWWILVSDAIEVGWFQILCGIRLIIAPFVLGYHALTSAMANDVIVGIIAVIVGGIEAQAMAHGPIKTA